MNCRERLNSPPTGNMPLHRGQNEPAQQRGSVREEPKQRNHEDHDPTDDRNPGPLDDPFGAMPLNPLRWESLSSPRPYLFAMPQVVNAQDNSAGTDQSPEEPPSPPDRCHQTHDLLPALSTRWPGDRVVVRRAYLA